MGGLQTYDPRLPGILRYNTGEVTEFTYQSADKNIGEAQMVSRVELPASSANNYTVTLPPLYKGIGREFVIIAHGSPGAGAEVTVAMADDGLQAAPETVFDAAGEVAVYRNIAGVAWKRLINTGAAVLEPDGIVLAQHQMIVGDSSGEGAAVSMSGDGTLADTGALTIGAGKITPSKTSSGVARGNGASYIKTANGAQTALLAAGAAGAARRVMGRITVTETFDDGDGTQPVFIIGQTGTTNKFVAATVLVDAVAGDVFTFSGELTAETALLATATAATGATSTGAITVDVVAVAEE